MMASLADVRTWTGKGLVNWANPFFTTKLSTTTFEA